MQFSWRANSRVNSIAVFCNIKGEFSELFFPSATKMKNVINAIQPKCVFSPFPPVMINHKYLLPEMENSFLISQMMVVFKVPLVCHV